MYVYNHARWQGIKNYVFLHSRYSWGSWESLCYGIVSLPSSCLLLPLAEDGVVVLVTLASVTASASAAAASLSPPKDAAAPAPPSCCSASRSFFSLALRTAFEVQMSHWVLFPNFSVDFELFWFWFCF